MHTTTSRPAPGDSVPARERDPAVLRRLDRILVAAAGLSLASGAFTLIAWGFDLAPLHELILRCMDTKPCSALALVLCGGSLWLQRDSAGRGREPGRRRAARALAGVVTVLALVSIVDHLSGRRVDVQSWLFPGAEAWRSFGSFRPGLMAPLTSVEFLLLGLALFWLNGLQLYRFPTYNPAPLLAFAAHLGAIVGLIDFVHRWQSSYHLIALQTSASLLALSTGVLCARTHQGFGALFASTGIAGALARRLWSGAILVPTSIATLTWTARSAGWLSEWSSTALELAAMITLLAGITIRSAQSLDRSETQRRAAEDSRQRSERELKEAQRLARMGSWSWEPASGSVTWSEGLYRLSGRDSRLPPPSLQEQSACYTPESYARLSTALERAAHTGAGFECELEMIRSDGEIRIVSSLGEAQRAGSGEVSFVRVSIHDITERKRTETALRESDTNLRKAQHIARIGSWRLDVARNQLSWSDEVYSIFGIQPGTALTFESFLATIHPDDRAAVNQAWDAALHGARYDIEHRITAGGTLKWVRERASVEFDENGRPTGGTGTVQDITERKHAQQEILRANRALRALSSCNQALIRATEESAWLNQVCHIVAEGAGYRFCWVGRREDDEAKTVTPVARAGFEQGYLDNVRVTWADTERGRGPVGTSIRSMTTTVVKDTATDPAFAPWREAALKRGYAAVISIPLIVDGQPYGALAIYAAEAGIFQAQEVSLLSELASDLAFGISSLRTRERGNKAEQDLRTLNAELEARVRARTADLETAREREAKIGFRIQQMLLLTQPPANVPGLQVAALTIPSQRIDGDFYDFIDHQNERLDVIVADVMGKGLPAALVAAATKSNFLEALCHLTAISGGQLPDPKEIVTLTHADMVRQLMELESFVTLSYARFDLHQRRLELVDCGHTGMMIVRAATGDCEILHGENLPLGIREGEIFDQLSVTFEPGDLFVFFSDGITDIRNPAGEFFGAERFAACVQAHRELSPQALIAAIRSTAIAFAGTDKLTDDLTCVALRIGDAPRPLATASLEILSDPAQLHRSRDFLRDFCRAAPTAQLDDDAIARFELALNEALSNIMKHGYHGRTDQRIQLEAFAFSDRVTLEIHHLGEPFHAANPPLPAFDGSKESGFGIYLMGNIVDEVRYSRDNRGRNCVTLVKTLEAQRRTQR